MTSFDLDMDGHFSDGHETMPMNNQKRKTGMIGLQFLNDSSHHPLSHRFIDFVQ